MDKVDSIAICLPLFDLTFQQITLTQQMQLCVQWKLVMLFGYWYWFINGIISNARVYFNSLLKCRFVTYWHSSNTYLPCIAPTASKIFSRFFFLFLPFYWNLNCKSVFKTLTIIFECINIIWDCLYFQSSVCI